MPQVKSSDVQLLAGVHRDPVRVGAAVGRRVHQLNIAVDGP